MQKFIIKTLPYILMIIMLVAVIIMWNITQKAKSDLETYKRIKDKVETTSEINKESGAVKDRDENVYPKIDKNIELINKSIKKLDKELDTLEKNKPTKEQSYDKFKNANFEEINKYYNSNPNTTTDNNSSSGNK